MEPLVGHCRADSGEHPDRGAVPGGDGSRPGSRRADHADPRRPIASRLKPRGQSRSTAVNHGQPGELMAQFGYTMMCEQSGPKDLVHNVVRAEQAGFDFAVISDHYSPWLEAQGHSPYAWAVLGAAAQATDWIPLMTFVTCPTLRYHPAVVAQKAATVALLSDGRFTLGLGAGENLNEHVVGPGWPAADIRQEK